MLAVWWIRLGIRPERIDKGVPQQNGVHERMHRTLKARRCGPRVRLARRSKRASTRGATRSTSGARTKRRRHAARAALHGLAAGVAAAAPAARVSARRRAAPRDEHGSISWRSEMIFLSAVLTGEYVALRETADDEWTITFGPLTLGTYSRAVLAFVPHVAWTPAPSECDVT